MHVRRHGACVLLAGLLLLAAGCGGSDDESAASTPSSSSSSASAEPSPEPSGGADACGAAQLEIQAGVQVTGYVTSVEVPTCDKAIVKTSLSNDENDVLSAVAICGIGTTQAAPQGVASVSVVGADGAELASGTSSADCRATA